MSEISHSSGRFGFLDDTIRGFGEKHRMNWGIRSALVACVDSCPSPGTSAGWQKALAATGVPFEVIGDLIWIPASHLAKAIETKAIFAGFDEIYLLKTKPATVAGIEKRFTSDWTNFSEGIPPTLAKQMESVGADGYFSDGCGLNYMLSGELLHQVGGL